ncbi:MAG: tRNA (adenosine(37)-N6)-dimethylallyltransferase MiaA [Gammaproteobacteria bacterium]|nr:tRNA (adenosine(37)-N6)-dimethylallyltransferase MiaA [Gammaproteobacteria bacterium]
MKVSSPRPPAVFLMGPTCSRKTELAVDLVRRLPCAIVSVDSAMVYRGMDIGTAKPGPEILRIAPHRVIDILDPAESYSAARFRADALDAMDEIARGGKIPLLVGGTMLYFRSLQRGLSPLPAADPAVRDRLTAEAQEFGWAALHHRLARIDPVAARRIHRHDPQRIQRALEVHEITGRTLTELWAQNGDQTLPYRVVTLAVAPRERALLHARIAERFHAMVQRGFIAEVERLRARGDLNPNLPSMRSVGYRQAWDYLEGNTSYGEMMQRAVYATRQLAKRQLTWLRAAKDAPFDSEGPETLNNMLELINKSCE